MATETVGGGEATGGAVDPPSLRRWREEEPQVAFLAWMAEVEWIAMGGRLESSRGQLVLAQTMGLLWSWGEASSAKASRFAQELSWAGEPGDRVARLCVGVAYLAAVAGSEGRCPFDIDVWPGQIQEHGFEEGPWMECSEAVSWSYPNRGVARCAKEAFEAMASRGSWAEAGHCEGIHVCRDWASDVELRDRDGTDCRWESLLRAARACVEAEELALVAGGGATVGARRL